MSIVKGDLVMVVRMTHKCAGSKEKKGAKTARLGTIFRIGRLWDNSRCSGCGELAAEYVAQPDSGEWIAYPLSWLKKIDPPSSGELTGVPLRLKEPA